MGEAIGRRVASESTAFASVALLFVFAGCGDSLRPETVAAIALAVERALSPFEAVPETKELANDVRHALAELDAGRLHATLPDARRPDAARVVLFEARDEESGRILRHEAPLEPPSDLFGSDGDHLRDVGVSAGDGWLFAAVRPLANSAGDYRLRVTTALGTGANDPLEVWRSLPEALRLLERSAQRPHDTDEARGAEPLLADFRRRFPKAARFVLRHFEVRATTKPAADAVAIALRLRVRFDALSESYPRLAGWLRRIARSARVSGVVCTGADGGEDRCGRAPSAAVLWRWSYEDPDAGLRISLRSREGRLVPEGGGAPVDLLAPGRYSFSTAGSSEAWGVRTSVEGLRGIARSDATSRVPNVSVTTRGSPDRLAVEGSFFGVVPVGAVDLVIPGNLSDIARSIASTMLLGREGRGVEGTTRLRTEASGRHAVTSTIVSDVPSGEIARIALRLGAALYRPDKRQSAEILRFSRDFLRAVRADTVQIDEDDTRRTPAAAVSNAEEDNHAQ